MRRGCLFAADGREVRLRPKSFEVLLHLVENSGRLIAKEELIQAVWPGTAVTDDSLVQCLIDVRRALGGDGQRLIRTVPRRGYIFEAEVSVKDPAGPERFAQEEEQAALPPAPVTGYQRPRPMTIGLLCAGVLVAMLAVASIGSRRADRATAPDIRSIAVLPLEDLSTADAPTYFADGMTEALITSLARVRALRVISRTSVMGYRGSRKPLPEIARELNVDAIVEGSLQRSAGRVRLTAKLVPAASDSPRWARAYERDLTDALTLQSEIARELADEIRIELTADERSRLGAIRRVDADAYDAYLRGQYANSIGNDEGWRQAIEYFQRAIRIDPAFAPAHAGLANAWHYRGTYGANAKEVESAARSAAITAVQLDDQLAEPHISLGIIKHNYDWDWTGAEEEFTRALRLDPGSVLAHIAYGHLLMHVGRHDEAIEEGEIAVRIDPLSSPTQASLGRFLYRARRYDEALQRLRRAVELEPRSIGANYRLGDLLAQTGDYASAIAAFERIGDIAPADFQVGIARVHALMGKTREARQRIRGLRANADAMATVYAALGEFDEAFGILDKAVAERQNIVSIKVDPPLDALHADPRWQRLLNRMHFPPDTGVLSRSDEAQAQQLRDPRPLLSTFDRQQRTAIR